MRTLGLLAPVALVLGLLGHLLGVEGAKKDCPYDVIIGMLVRTSTGIWKF